jgi:hypothetical protein
MFLSRWTAHEQWNIIFIPLKTRREEGHQFVNLLPDIHAKYVIIQWITCVVPKHDENCDTRAFLSCSWQRCNFQYFSIFFHPVLLVPITSRVYYIQCRLIHGQAGQLLWDTRTQGPHANLCMLCTSCFFYVLTLIMLELPIQ